MTGQRLQLPPTSVFGCPAVDVPACTNAADVRAPATGGGAHGEPLLERIGEGQRSGGSSPRHGASVAGIMADIKLPWLSGKDASSRREGYLYWIGTGLYGIKWRNSELALIVQKYLTDPVGKLPSRTSSI